MCRSSPIRCEVSASVALSMSRLSSCFLRASSSKVLEGYHPRGTTLREALRGNLKLRGLCGGLSEGSAGSLRGFCGVSAWLCRGPRDFPRVFRGSDPMLVTLGNCRRRGGIYYRVVMCCARQKPRVVNSSPLPHPMGSYKGLPCRITCGLQRSMVSAQVTACQGKIATQEQRIAQLNRENSQIGSQI